jgi:hypothetical protein
MSYLKIQNTQYLFTPYIPNKSCSVTMKGMREKSQNPEDSWSPSCDWKLEPAGCKVGMPTIWL